MKTKLFAGMLMSILVIFSINVFAQETNYSNIIFPIEQVKHGMTGYGISDLGPDVPNTFKFKVTSVEHNANGLGHDTIWALLYDNPKLKDGGVIAGMSGSPCYSEDGRFLGTVSYGWSNSIEPKAGITPAKEVLSVRDRESKSLDSINNSSENISRQDGNSKLSLMCFNINGDPYKYDDLSRLFITKPVFSGSGNQTSQTNFSCTEKTLKPGDSIGVGLVIGDVTIAGTGTVSFVDGKNVRIFGHPIFQMGEVNFPMLSAKTEDVTLLRSRSFKEASTGDIIGTFTQDRLTGVYGHLGQMPDMIPIMVNLERNGKKQTLHFYIVRQKKLTPIMLKLAIDSLLTEFSDDQELSVYSKGEICIKGAAAKSLYFLEHGEGLVSKVKDYYAKEIKGALTPKNKNDEKDVVESPMIESVNINLSVSEGDGVFHVGKIKINSPKDSLSVNYNLDIILENNQDSQTLNLPIKIPFGFNGEIEVVAGGVEIVRNFGAENVSWDSKFDSQEGSLYVKITYRTSWFRQVIKTEIYEIALDNVFVKGRNSVCINLSNTK